MRMVKFYGREFPIKDVVEGLLNVPKGSLFDDGKAHLCAFELYLGHMGDASYVRDEEFELTLAVGVVRGELAYLERTLGDTNYDWRGEFEKGTNAAKIFGRMPETREEAIEQRRSLMVSSAQQRFLKEAVSVCDRAIGLFGIDEPEELGKYREFLVENCSKFI